MALRNWDSQRARQEMSRLVAPGLIGFYTHFEATEVFATQGQGPPFNVFSLLVAEERLPEASEKPHYYYCVTNFAAANVLAFLLGSMGIVTGV
jgi:hypothetical protein